MNGYIRKSAASEMLMDIEWENGTLTAAILMLNDIPTVDETEIIRKAFERVVERLEEKENKYANAKLEFKGTMTEKSYEDRLDSIRYAIEIVKEVGGIE